MNRIRVVCRLWQFHQIRTAFLIALWFASGLIAGVYAHAQVAVAGSQFQLAPGTWSKPTGIAVDAQGNLLVADAGLGSVIELPAQTGGFGAPETLLSGLSNPSALALDNKGNLYIADTGDGRILMLPVGKSGFGPSAVVVSGLEAPVGMAFDTSGNLFFADSQANVVMKCQLVAGAYGAPAIVGSGFNGPMGVAIDPSGDLLVADAGNHRITRQIYSNGTYSSPGTFWSALTPVSMWADSLGDLFISDAGMQRVIEQPWNPTPPRYVTSVPIGSLMVSPAGVAADLNGNTYIADAAGEQVLQVTGNVLPFGPNNVGFSTSSITYNFRIPAGTSLGQTMIAMKGASGKDFFSAGQDSCSGQSFLSAANCGVSVVFTPSTSGARSGGINIQDNSGNRLATAYLTGTGIAPQPMYVPGTMTVLASDLNAPAGVAVDGNGNVFISDTGNNRVLELPVSGNGYRSLAQVPVSGLNSPAGLAVDGAGYLYITSYGNDLVFRIACMENGFGIQTKVGTGLYGPMSVVIDPLGTVYITELLAQKLLRLTWTGTKYNPESWIGSYTKTPTGLAINTHGSAFFTSAYSNYVAEVPWNGIQFGTQRYVNYAATSFPYALVMDGNDNLFLLDTKLNLVWMLPWDGSNYDSPIVVASGLNAPQGLAIDAGEALYIADTGNNRIVKIDLSSPGTLSFANTYVGSTSAGGAQSAYVRNGGNDLIELGDIGFPVDFSETSTSICAPDSVLDPGTGCVLTVNFTPQKSGSPLIEALNLNLGTKDSEVATAFHLTGVSLAKMSQTLAVPGTANIVYGVKQIPLTASASSGLPVTYQVISGPGVVQQSGNSYLLRILGAGAIAVDATQPGNSQYLPALSAMFTVEVAPATVNVVPSNTNAVYGSVPSSFGYALQGLVNGESAANVITGQPTITVVANSSSPVGSYMITASQGTLAAANYVFVFSAGMLTINPAVLQVTANALTRSYGVSNPALTWRVSGFVHGDSSNAISGAPALVTEAYPGSPVGMYPIQISPGTLSAANYKFVLQGATMQVTPATLTVATAATSVTYGQSIPVLKYVLSGFLNGDSAAVVHGAASLSTIAVAGSGAGNYLITCTSGTLSAANYSFKCVNGTLSVQKAQLLVSPADSTMAYGGAVPAVSYTVNGFVNGDTAAGAVTGTPGLSISANSRSKPGKYSITASMGFLSAKNYSFAFAAATMTVTKALLTVTAQPTSATYGTQLPKLVPVYSGFVNGDTIASAITGAPLLNALASASSAVGTYPVSVAVGTLASSLYDFTIADGILTIKPAVLTMTPVSQSVVYGTGPGPLTFMLAGLMNGDTAATAISGVPQLSTTAITSSKVGSYPITASAGSMTSANYTLQFKSGTITVTPSALKVAANNISAVQGSALPSLTFAASGFVNGDTLADAITGAPALSTNANMAQAGSYPITISKGTMAAANYQLTFVNGVLTVTPPANTSIVKPAPQPPRIRSTAR